MRKQTDAVGEQLGRDFAAASHQFFRRRGNAECLFVKLDRELITDAEHFAMMFATISDAVFAQQFRVDLIPPWLRIGEDAVEIENHSAKLLRHGAPHFYASSAVKQRNAEPKPTPRKFAAVVDSRYKRIMTRASEQEQSNPLREGLTNRAVPQTCNVVIFGATGDLTHRKLVPALYNIAAGGELPPSLTVVGFARRAKSDDEFRKELEEAARKHSRQEVRDDLWKGFAQSIFYHRGEFHDESAYKSLAERLDKNDEERGTRGNRLFYLAVGPEQFETIIKNLKAVGLNKARKTAGRESSWKNRSGAISIRRKN